MNKTKIVSLLGGCIALASTLTSCGDDEGFVFVKGGTFQMGCTAEQVESCEKDENPIHQVSVGDFYIGKYEVTQKEWMDVMGNNPSNFKGCDSCPVENVSWDDAIDFIHKLRSKSGNSKKYRLPTEAEWEYAARGGSKSKGYKYSGSDNIDEVAWYYENSGDSRLSDSAWSFESLKKNYNSTHKVGAKKPNALGIHDMSGNVWEWVNDRYGNYEDDDKTQVNPQGAKSGSYRVIRGGSWNFVTQGLRVSYRYRSRPSDRDNSLGFRLVYSL